MQPFADGHAHPGEMTVPYQDYGEAGIVLGCASRPEDWRNLEMVDDPRVVRFYGVHPWYADEWSGSVEEMLRSLLSRDPRAGIGEIGLDSHRGDEGKQIPVLRRQLGIASELGRAVSIHDLGCEKVLLDILNDLRPSFPVVLHAFSRECYSKPFAELGCFMSINPRILSRSPERISRLMDSIPGDLLLLESDAPWTPKGFLGMRRFAEQLSEACGISAESLLKTSYDNARRIAEWTA